MYLIFLSVTVAPAVCLPVVAANLVLAPGRYALPTSRVVLLPMIAAFSRLKPTQRLPVSGTAAVEEFCRLLDRGIEALIADAPLPLPER